MRPHALELLRSVDQNVRGHRGAHLGGYLREPPHEWQVRAHDDQEIQVGHGVSAPQQERAEQDHALDTRQLRKPPRDIERLALELGGVVGL